ncbi:MAG: HypC/HybG/HupF family hydrogenase formation chaperone [Mariprofundaceae bacterium]|nr:HypC/HybG/HupF family hydrogenase formation chaperone [Mariprofundaceae bacterium]
MCLAIPARIVAMDGESATVALGGVKKCISTALLDDLKIDDYVLVHVGYALHKVSEDEAEKTLALFAEAGLSPDDEGAPA